MPSFNVQLHKQGFGEKWTNLYRVFVDTGIDAVVDNAVPALVDLERNLHDEGVEITYARVSSTTVGDEVFETVPINEFGLDPSSDDYLPLFCTLKIDVAVGLGRPSGKFYRLPIPTSEISGLLMNAIFVDNRAAMVQGLIDDMTALGFLLTDPDNQEWADASGHRVVQMRQLHRKRRRAAEP